MNNSMSHFINTYWYINQIFYKGAKEIIQKMQFDLILDTTEDEPPAKKQSTLTHRFADWQDDAPCASAPAPVDDEIWWNMMTEYLSSQLSVSDNPDPDNVLQWCKFNKERFPALSKLARFIFSIPASSVPSEGAFSVCGRILEEKRMRLGPQSVGNILFLHSNIKANFKDNMRRFVKWICLIH